MSDIHIQRSHSLGLPEAREIARVWAVRAEEKFDVACTYDEGVEQDVLHFSRSGVDGSLLITSASFDFDVKLGLLMGVFKDQIAQKIHAQFDELLGISA